MAMYFLDGSNEKLNCGTGINVSLQPFSWCGWMRRTRTGDYDPLISQGSKVLNNGLEIGYFINNYFRFNIWNSWLESQAAVTDSDWHFWAGTYNNVGNARTLYKDGVLDANDTAPGDYAGSGTFWVAADLTTREMTGELDDVRFYDSKILTPNDIMTIYTSRGRDGIRDGLVLRFTFLEKAPGLVDGTVPDVSGNGNNGVAVGTPEYRVSPLNYRRRAA